MLSFLAVFIACNKDDNSDNAQLLSYDASNANAPDLPAGNYIFGVRFPPNETEVFKDSLLTEIRFYVKIEVEDVRGNGRHESNLGIAP